jgi:hypothetical protein
MNNCKRCGHQYADNLKQCPACGFKPLSIYINGSVLFGIITAALISSVLLVYFFMPVGTLGTGNAQNSIEYYYEDKTELLLDRGAYLQGGDSISFDIRIPLNNVTTMDGTISVNGKNFLDVEFQDSNGATYCDQCKRRVYGDESREKINEIHDAIRIDVKKGDLIKLLITSPENARLQTVNIKLQVSYLEQYQLIAPTVSTNATR